MLEADTTRRKFRLRSTLKSVSRWKGLAGRTHKSRIKACEPSASLFFSVSGEKDNDMSAALTFM